MSHALEQGTRPVLVVEDCDDDFDTVLVASRRGQVRSRIVRAASAEAARNLLPDGGAAEDFAFVLLDQNLPGASGSDFLRELRQDEAYRQLPVIFFTTSKNPRDRDACYGAGANAYHVKPVRFDECLDTLAEVFHYWLHEVLLPHPPRRRKDREDRLP